QDCACGARQLQQAERNENKKGDIIDCAAQKGDAPKPCPRQSVHLYSAADFRGGKAGVRIVIALLAGKDQDVAPGVGERKGKIAEESTARGLIGMKIAIYENEPRQ